MDQPPAPDQIYYRHAGSIGLIRRISFNARMSVFRLFMETLRPDAADTVLDVGVSLDVTSPESNILEQFYPHRAQLTCAGIGDGGAVTAAYPGVRFTQITPHAPLPFAQAQFDIAYSNAVVEHVGSREQQQAFIAELFRVARRVFVVVPNRLFPIEHHTGLPLVHWLPLPAFRGLLRRTKFSHWSQEENLNPLFAAEFQRLFPAGKPVDIRYAGLGIGMFRSNVIGISCMEPPRLPSASSSGRTLTAPP